MSGWNGISTLGQVLGSLSPNGSGNGVASTAETAAVSPVKPSPLSPEKSSVVSKSDTASVSTASGLISQALNTSDVRLDKVTALQTSIQSGSYQVAAPDVASKIVESLLA